MCATENIEEAGYDPRRWLALAVVLCATLLGVLDFLIVNIAVPSIERDLGTTDAEVQLTIAGYGLVYAVCLITGGRLGDIFGRKRMFLLGMLGFTFASALCGAAQTPMQLIGARLLQGLLASAMTPQVLSIIQVSFPPQEKGLAFAIMGVVVGIGSFIGNVFGGWLVGANVLGLGWRPIFFVNVPIGICAMTAAWFLVRESKSPSATSLDWGGVVLSGVGLFLLIFPLAEGREAGWPAWAFVCIAASVVVLWGFLRFERVVKNRGGAPLVDVNLFEESSFTAGLIAVLTLFGGIGSFALTFTLFLQKGFDVTPAHTGMIFAPLALGFLPASLFAVKLAKRLGSKVLILGLSIMLLGQALMMGWIYFHGAALNPYTLMPILFLYGIGQGTTVPRLMGTVLSNVSADNAGAASGVLTTTQQVAFSLGVSIIGSIFFTALGKEGGPEAYVRAFVTVLVCSFGMLTFTMYLLSRLIRVAENLPHHSAQEVVVVEG